MIMIAAVIAIATALILLVAALLAAAAMLLCSLFGQCMARISDITVYARREAGCQKDNTTV